MSWFFLNFWMANTLIYTSKSFGSWIITFISGPSHTLKKSPSWAAQYSATCAISKRKKCRYLKIFVHIFDENPHQYNTSYKDNTKDIEKWTKKWYHAKLNINATHLFIMLCSVSCAFIQNSNFETLSCDYHYHSLMLIFTLISEYILLRTLSHITLAYYNIELFHCLVEHYEQSL